MDETWFKEEDLISVRKDVVDVLRLLTIPYSSLQEKSFLTFSLSEEPWLDEKTNGFIVGYGGLFSLNESFPYLEVRIGTIAGQLFFQIDSDGNISDQKVLFKKTKPGDVSKQGFLDLIQSVYGILPKEIKKIKKFK